MNGGEALVATLAALGVDMAFGVTGESYLTVVEALRKSRSRIRLIPTRHESGASFAAAAYARFARRPAAVFVSRGPGATNASVGVHMAAQDSQPLLLFVGQVPQRVRGREAFQEIDFHKMYAPIAKSVIEPHSAAAVAESTARAHRLALSGRPGPVVVVLPRDVSEGDAGDAAIPSLRPAAAAGPDPAAVERAASLIRSSRHPLVIAGELVGFERADAALQAFVAASGAGVFASYRRQDAFPNDHPAYFGHLEINRDDYQREAWASADVIVAAGARLDGITTEEFTAIRPDHRLIHVFPDDEVLARFSADCALASPLKPTLEALTRVLNRPPPDERLVWRASFNARYRRFSTPGDVRVHGSVDLARIVEDVARAVPADAIIVTDSGSFARWVHRYYRFTRPDSQAGPGGGSMGYGLPGALGAQLACPERTVVAFVGDGSLLMTVMELATAAEERLPVKLVVCDNQAWGSILAAQHKAFGPSAEYGTRLQSPDFAALAGAFGVPASTVRATAEFGPAFARALATSGPALIHLLTDRRDISPYGVTDSRV